MFLMWLVLGEVGGWIERRELVVRRRIRGRLRRGFCHDL